MQSENSNDYNSKLFRGLKLSIQCEVLRQVPGTHQRALSVCPTPSCMLPRDKSFLSFSALMWKMALPQVAARWTPRPALPRGWYFTPPFPGTASGESPFSTDQTATMTCHQRRCRETLRFPASSEYQLRLAPGLTLTSSLTLSQQQQQHFPLSSQGGARRKMSVSRGDGDDHREDFNALELGSPRASHASGPVFSSLLLLIFFWPHSLNC